MARRLFLIVLSVGLVSALSCSGRSSPPLPDDGPLGPFSLKERSGRTVTDDDLKGKVWIACFIFTRCTGPCPQVTGTMARLQQELNLAAKDDLRLVTITVDPERDDPAELTEYARKFQAHPEKWLFLTGKQDEIHELCNKQFRVAASENAKKTPGDEFSHSTRLVLIDKRGHKRGYFEGLPVDHTEEAYQDFEKSQEKLRQAVASLLRERAAPTAIDFPLLNACLNAAAGVLLVVGYVAIRRRFIALHKALMLAALAISTVFLSSYLYYHIVVQQGRPTHFSQRAPEAPPWVAKTYLAVLLTHTVLAAAAAPLALATAYLGLRDRLQRHVWLARWTLPIWLYVSITGVVVYLMLYRLYG